jgi:sec-independent protein translocase protein TatA
MPFGIGIWEMLVLLGVLLLVFGPKKLPELGRSLGKGVRELREGISGEAEAVETAAAELDHAR